jgi:hypothetical protein
VSNWGVDAIEQALDFAPKTNIIDAKHASTDSIIINYIVITALSFFFFAGILSLYQSFYLRIYLWRYSP